MIVLLRSILKCVWIPEFIPADIQDNGLAAAVEKRDAGNSLLYIFGLRGHGRIRNNFHIPIKDDLKALFGTGRNELQVF